MCTWLQTSLLPPLRSRMAPERNRHAFGQGLGILDRVLFQPRLLSRT